MLKNFIPQDQTFWYLNQANSQPLKETITTDVVVVGGGMAGICAAYAFAKKGLSVALLEKNFCGSGASGKSSGFITPDSELSLYAFMDAYGLEEAKKIWDFVQTGVHHIARTIDEYSIECSFTVEDTLVVANTRSAFKNDISVEHEVRKKLGYESTLYGQEELGAVLNATGYKGGVAYSGSFGIQAYLYCLAMKKVLQESGVQVYEETPVTALGQKKVDTVAGSVNADFIIVCVDRYLPFLNSHFYNKVYHAQTHLLLTRPLSESEVKQIFPGKRYMVWDTDLIYQYYRLAPDNRLMLGGGSYFDTYERYEQHKQAGIIAKLQNYAKKRFPQIDLTFEYIWPGLIGLSQDFFPVAGFDEQNKSVYYIAAAAGLPWAAALGLYSADRILNADTRFDTYVSPERKHLIGPALSRVLGPKLTFALANIKSVYL